MQPRCDVCDDEAVKVTCFYLLIMNPAQRSDLDATIN